MARDARGRRLVRKRSIAGCMRGWSWLLAALCAIPAIAQQSPDVPYVQTPANVVDAMLEMARLTSADYLVDLGSGDGRIVIQAARKYGVRSMGVEIDPNLVRASNQEAKRQGVVARRGLKAAWSEGVGRRTGPRSEA